MLKSLNNRTVPSVKRPVRVLQFGEGNFLRAFVDWQIDIANEKGVIDTDVAIVPPRFNAGRAFLALKAQDGLYNVLLEGIENGKPKQESRLVKCVAEVIAPREEYQLYRELILSPDLRFVISNTTEAGIRYEPDDVRADIPATFPGKVTNLLWQRWQHFGNDSSKGLVFMPCELIDDNGTTLRSYVLRHAAGAALPAEFIKWVENDCIFVDTLVDRIVSGFPADSIDELKAGLGYDDNCLVKGELYHLWAIGGKGWEVVKKEFPLDRAELHVLFMPSVKAFRDKKVHILNGSHTGMVAIALQLGCETVMDAFNNPEVNRFINDMVAGEVLPMIEGDKAELKVFADGILERFYNPYIRHFLKSIALNSLSKWEARNYPTARDYFARTGKIAWHEAFSFAALLNLYGPDSGFEPEDNAAHVETIRTAWNPSDFDTTVRTILDSGIFIENFGQTMSGFTDVVADYLADIRTQGMAAAIEKVNRWND